MFKIKYRSGALENIVIPLFKKSKPPPCRLKSVYEIGKDLKRKIYTNLYAYNTTCKGIFISRGINDINGFRNCGKTSICSHICVNLFFNDLLHFFHLFYTTYFCFENFLKQRNLENKISKKLSSTLKRNRKKFAKKNKSFEELQEVTEYFTEIFIKKYGQEKNQSQTATKKAYKTDDEGNTSGTQKVRNEKRNIQNRTQEPHQFSKKRVIYIDLDGGFYIERYNNMIRSTIDRIQNLMKTYLQFVAEKDCTIFLLFLENKKLKQKLSQIYKNYKEEPIFFIDLFNYYLKKYVTDISFNEVQAHLQILKIFHFQELVNTIVFISKQIEKYHLSYTSSTSLTFSNPSAHCFHFPHFNKHVSQNLGIVVVDNLYHLYRSNEYSVSLKNQLLNVLKHLYVLSTRYKICVLVTNTYTKYSKIYDELFNRLYSPYLYIRLVLKFLNKRLYYEHNYHLKETEMDNFIDNDDDPKKTRERQNYHFREKRFNLRYIQVQKKKKKYSFFFEINTQGIQMIME